MLDTEADAGRWCCSNWQPLDRSLCVAAASCHRCLIGLCESALSAVCLREWVDVRTPASGKSAGLNTESHEEKPVCGLKSKLQTSSRNWKYCQYKMYLIRCFFICVFILLICLFTLYCLTLSILKSVTKIVQSSVVNVSSNPVFVLYHWDTFLVYFLRFTHLNCSWSFSHFLCFCNFV